jgi:nicotinate-nucleotide pyrophosphorylase (carboxylating)
VKLETIALPLVNLALTEDLGGGDVTTTAVVGPEVKAEATIVAKANGVIAGLDVARIAFQFVDEDTEFEVLVSDGNRVQVGRPVAHIRGLAASLLMAERVALNFLCHLSGVATLTSRFVRRARGTRAAILDTRKTIPGLRVLQKYAVRKGGGENHRFGLFDMYLIKDNHIAVAGSLKNAVARVQEKRQELLLEVEADSFERVKEACEADVDRILLDNMSIEQIATSVQIVDNHPKPPTPPRTPDPAAHTPRGGAPVARDRGLGKRQPGQRARDRRAGCRLHLHRSPDPLGPGAGSQHGGHPL